MTIKKLILIISILIFQSHLAQVPTVLDKVIATVNDQIILLSDISYQRKLERDSTLKDCEILQKLLIEKMLIAKAEKDSITVTEAEVDAEIERRMAYFTAIFGTQDKLEKYYGKTLSELKLYFREDITNKLRADRTKSKLFASKQPSPKQVKNYFESLNSDSIPYYNTELQLQQIVFFPKITRENKRTAREKANSILKKILSKEADLGTQAILYSDDVGTASRGGELGWIHHGEMVPEFEQAAFSTKVGGISDIIETRYGYHIIEVLDKKQDKVRVRHVLISPKSNDQDYQECKKMADSVAQMISEKKITFEKAVELYSDDDLFKQNGGIIYNFDTRTSIFKVEELEPDLAQSVAKLKVGEISSPMEYQSRNQKIGYRIVRLMRETPPHKASIETDYSKIKMMNMEDFRKEAVVNWYNSYKHLLYINIDPEFKYCNH